MRSSLRPEQEEWMSSGWSWDEVTMTICEEEEDIQVPPEENEDCSRWRGIFLTEGHPDCPGCFTARALPPLLLLLLVLGRPVVKNLQILWRTFRYLKCEGSLPRSRRSYLCPQVLSSWAEKALRPDQWWVRRQSVSGHDMSLYLMLYIIGASSEVFKLLSQKVSDISLEATLRQFFVLVEVPRVPGMSDFRDQWHFLNLSWSRREGERAACGCSVVLSRRIKARQSVMESCMSRSGLAIVG